MNTETFKVGDIVYAFDNKLKWTTTRIVSINPITRKYMLETGDHIGEDQMTKESEYLFNKMGDYAKILESTKPQKPPRRKPLKRHR